MTLSSWILATSWPPYCELDCGSKNFDTNTVLLTQELPCQVCQVVFEKLRQIWFYWMLYDHLSAHSLLAKLGQRGWFMRMRLAWKKSQKTLDLYVKKILHQNKTRSTGNAGKGLHPNFAIIETADSGKVQDWCVTPEGT